MHTLEILVSCYVFGICSGVFQESYLAIQDQAFLYKYTYKKETERSFHDCAGRCQESDVCLSFSYDTHGHVCHLNNNNTDIASIKHRTNFIYAKILHKSSTCSSDRSCEGEFAGCGEPPEVTGADKEYDGQFLHAVTNYTCKTDYVNCLGRNTSVCQPSGNWKNVTGMCGRNMWTNPETGTSFNLPCGATESFTLHIAGSPAENYSRMTFDLLTSSKNLILHFDVRFNYQRSKKTILIGRRINGKWGKGSGKDLSTFPFEVGRPFTVSITSKNGTFTIEVDNVFLTTYPMVEAPDYFRVKNDVALATVKFDI